MEIRKQEFWERGARIYGLSADAPGQNSAVMVGLALSFPILSDISKDEAIRPLGFDDERDPRRISLPGVVIITPEGEIAHRYVGRDFADRPDEDHVLSQLEALGLEPTSQESARPGPVQPGPTAMSVAGLPHYLRGAKFASLALRRRHRHISEEFKDDTKNYAALVDRYLEALAAVEERKA